MNETRKVEIFSAGCPACNEAVHLVEELKCPSCEVLVFDMMDPVVAKRAGEIGVRSVPAVVVDGKLVDCCRERGPSGKVLEAAGIGRSIE